MKESDRYQGGPIIPKWRSWRAYAAVAAFVIFASLVFIRLGHYSLWDDECYTALFAKGICRTGDMSALIDDNIVAKQNGWSLRDLKERFYPPLPFYLTAASFKTFGTSAWTARLPFALAGLLSFAFLLRWLWRDDADPWTWATFLIALLSNVSFVLYFRQCRYYGLITLGTIAASYVYVHWSKSVLKQAFLVVSLSILLASNYIHFAAAVGCLAVDWIFWGRRTVRPDWRQLSALIALQILAFSFMIVWNPFLVHHVDVGADHDDLWRRLAYFWYDARDLSVNEFWIAPLLLAAPIIAWWKRDPLLFRCFVVIAVFFTTVAVSSERLHGTGEFGDIRYFTPIIPICCFLESRILLLVCGKIRWFSLVLALAVFGTNLLSGSTFFRPAAVPIPIRSTLLAYGAELIRPTPDPYAVTGQWLRENTYEDASVFALPDYTCYPLMFLAPSQVYAWQLNDSAGHQFEKLPQIHFIGRTAPRYIVLFGPAAILDFRRLFGGANSPRYNLVQTIPVFWRDSYRPELFLRFFSDPPPPASDYNGIYILQRAD